MSIGCTEGFIGEDMFFYAGPGRGAAGRAGQARSCCERFEVVGLEAEEVRIDFLGVNAIHGAATPAGAPSPTRWRCGSPRAPARVTEAMKVGREVDGMAVSGIAMTGKRVPHQDRTREVIGIWSTLVPREAVPCQHHHGARADACGCRCSTSPTSARATRATRPTSR